ncbi:hypothetical protein KDA14_01570 [Candidatus Saccharibacteria bacterium]|nr:hypothetical protein [Candidatus Saccharibacteria bacterium]
MGETLQKKRKIPRWITFASLGLSMLAIAGTVTIVLLGNKRPADLNDVHVVVAKVDALYQLPTDEAPALLTVTDTTKISSNLAKKVQNGDKLLIYQKNQQAIIYRPSSNKIIGIIPVDIDDLPADSSKAQ